MHIIGLIFDSKTFTLLDISYIVISICNISFSHTVATLH